jgi:hypothetical protein
MNPKGISIFISVCMVTLPFHEAQAYIDPGTGTLLIQWLFGIVMAGLATLTIYWQRAKSFLSRRGKHKNAAQETDGESENPGPN